MSEEISVIGYQKEILIMDLKLFKLSEQVYDLVKMVECMNILKEGFYVKRINKPTKTGTKFTTKAIESKECFNNAIAFINSLIEDYNQKYGGDFKPLKEAE